MLAVLGYWWWATRQAPPQEARFITSFEECVAAGYPVMESYPRQCRTPEGAVYTEEIGGERTATATGGCFIGGCNSEICSDQEGMMSTCEYRPEYACYETAQCGRGEGGACGWRQTPELTACLSADFEGLSK